MDRIFKAVTVDDPQALRYLSGDEDLPPGSEIAVASMEIAPNFEVDGVLRITTPDGLSWLDHYEFKSRYRSDTQIQRMKYGFALYLGPETLPIRSTMLVILPDDFPKNYEELLPYEIPRVVSLRFRTLKVWEFEAERAFKWSRPSLMAIVPFMKSSRAQEIEAARRVKGDTSARMLFDAAMRVKYDERELAGFWEEIEMDIAERMVSLTVPTTKWGQEMIERESRPLVEASLQRGIEQGRLRESIDSVKGVFAARFPSAPAPGLAFITDPAVARRLCSDIAVAASAAEAQAIIARLAAGPLPV